MGYFGFTRFDWRIRELGIALLPTTRSWGGIMVQTIRRPEEILAYRTLQQILVSKPKELWSARPCRSAF